MSDLEKVTIHFEWKSGMHELIESPHPIEFATHLGASSDAARVIQSKKGAIFGIVADGFVRIRKEGLVHDLERGQWFVFDVGQATVITHDITKVLFICAIGKSQLFQLGGPIEMFGRLRYIDGCSDTVLIHPWKRGEPCLNHLHFPPGIVQTMHTHPSERIGVVVRGHGWCESPTEKIRLDIGTVFRIPTNAKHRFVTEAGSMGIIAFHPDSDVGPTDDDHPMVNRTIVDGVSAKHIDKIRTRHG